MISDLTQPYYFDFISYFLILSLFCQFLNKVVSVGVFPIHEGPIFFSRVIIIIEMRLKFQLTRHLEYWNMSQLIPHCSKNEKIDFFKKLPAKNFGTKLIFLQTYFGHGIHCQTFLIIFFLLIPPQGHCVSKTYEGTHAT